MDKAEFEKFLKKQHKSEIIDGHNYKPTKYYNTGTIGLDIASGIGGFPRGKVIEIFGPESSGKSLTALKAVATAQKLYGLPSLYLDLEAATPLSWMETLGVDLNMLTFLPADPSLTGEKALDIVRDAVKANIYAYVVVDSVVGLVPKAELEGSIQNNYVATRARVVSKGISVIVPEFSQSDTTVIFINQIRMNVGVMFGNPEVTPGGKAIKFYAAQRYRVSKKSASDKKDGKDIVGHTVRVKNVKNKLGPPHREAEYDIYYTRGVDDIANLHKIGLDYDIITQDGHTHTFTGIDDQGAEIVLSARGRDAFREALSASDVAQRLIYAQILEQFFAGKVRGVEQGSSEE